MRYVLCENMPLDIRGFVFCDPETDDKVCILNAKLTYEANKKTAIHELKHLVNNDFENEENVDEIEFKRHREE